MMTNESDTFKTWEQLSRKEQLACMISDDYKSLYGFRPRHNFLEWTEEELEQYHKSIVDDLMAEIERERQEEERHQKAIENAMKPKTWTIGDVLGMAF
jgi:predicted transcriptional regulator